MEYIYKEGKAGLPVFLLLHGTGGTEKDLLPIAEILNPDYSVLSLRGDVNENGMNRFFKRLAEGQYDVEDLQQRGKDMVVFLHELAAKHGFDVSDLIPVGFSNGSNIAVNLLVEQDIDFKKALLFAPLYPIKINKEKSLKDMDVFLSMGKVDPICPVPESQRVINIFESRGANVESFWTRGHQLDGEILAAAKNFLDA